MERERRIGGEAKRALRRADGRPSLGLAMIVKNEERNLPLSLGPLAGLVEQAVVVDTGSSDGTRALAESYGATVVSFKWIGDFSAARNHGLALMATDHVMWLDSDNSMTAADLEAIRAHLSFGPGVVVATEVVAPQGDELWQKRAFFNSPLARFQGTVHEQLSHPAGWPVKTSSARILHWGYSEAAAARAKGQRNLELLVSAPETAAGDLYHLYQTGRTLLNLRYLKEAEEYLARAAWGPAGSAGEAAGPGPEANPSIWSHAVILLAQAQDRLGEGAKSESSLRALARLRPGYGPGLAYLGKLLFESGRLEEAAQELERALALGCGDPGWGASEAKLGFQAACLLARAYERIGRPLAGWRAWRAASSFAPDHPEPYVAMAETSMAGGDRAAAKELIERAISLAPAHRRALMVSSHLEAGR